MTTIFTAFVADFTLFEALVECVIMLGYPSHVHGTCCISTFPLLCRGFKMGPVQIRNRLKDATGKGTYIHLDIVNLGNRKQNDTGLHLF